VIAEFLDQLQLWLDAALLYWEQEIQFRSTWDWCLFFLPLLLLDIPRFSVPAIVLSLLHYLRRMPDDQAKRKAFIATKPKVSALIAGYNEEEIMDKVIESLLELEYPNLEIIVVDDNSEDRMYQRAKPYADKGLIKLWKNTEATGRTGRASASNLALHCSSGDFILSVDADTSFDRDLITNMIGPFYDKSVGVVAGNLKVRNFAVNYWTAMQGVEYMLSIGLWKSWLHLFRANMMASGALGAFRREAIMQFGGWDPELAEDTDLSLKARKGGWKVAFAPQGLAMTNAPTRFITLVKQRIRWDKGTFRTFYRKHLDLMNLKRFDPKAAVEMSIEFVFSILAAYAFLVYLLYMLWYSIPLLILVLVTTYIANTILAIGSVSAAIYLSERRRDEWPLLWMAPLLPFYKEIFRLIRIYATTIEIFRVNYEEPFLPQSAWRNTPRW
jgi:poly-beta-1,6-N-acetyl-D-glucosamine synthase